MNVEQTGMVRVIKIELRPDDGRPVKAVIDVQVGDMVTYGWKIIK